MRVTGLISPFLIPAILTHYRVSSPDVQNKGTVGMLEKYTSLLGPDLYFYAKSSFCFKKPIWTLVT